MRLETYEERYKYLRLGGEVGAETFGFDRFLNQEFYRSRSWKKARDEVISRDLGCDLGDPDRPIAARIIVHHMNPIRPQELMDFHSDVYNPEFLITTCHDTHNAIHYGDESLLRLMPPERMPWDTVPWR